MMTDTHFDAIVVGSGFGGSVTAYRLAEAGMRVCLLERGKAYPPGSFPRSPAAMRRNFWDPSAGLHGLFNIWSFGGFDAIIASGLGGGSLVYSNVEIRKDEKWFVKEDLQNGGYEYWPVTRADLDPHYDRVEKMLNVQRYPFDRAPYNLTPRTNAIKNAAEQLGLDWQLPPLAVTFANDGEPASPGELIRESAPNLHGRQRDTCRLCGECNVGCNFGSKNSLDYNYLSAAMRLGADIRTRCEVRSFEPRDGGGYTVRYVAHDLASEGVKTATAELPLQTLSADHLILSAGTLGSTYLLLKNRAAFPNLSDQLGTHFSGNGDLLTLAVLGRTAQGGASKPANFDPAYGAAITAAIRVPDAADGAAPGARGHYVEDAGYPELINWIVEMVNVPGTVKRLAHFTLARLKQAIGGPFRSDLSSDIAGLLGPATLSSSSLPLLGMGRDIPDGRAFLRDKLLDIDWTTRRSNEFFQQLMGTMRNVTTAMGATFVPSPTWLFNRVITVHALGGCPMGRDEREGVLNAYGEVFNYPGLHVADGSVMPGAVGTNPSLTIAAVADRFADRIIETHRTARGTQPVVSAQ
jgi:cholesterol oxidase